MTTKKKTKAYADAPGYRRAWVRGAIVRDDAGTLWRVTGRPVRYHEDCPSMSPVSRVRETPPEWRGMQRVLAIVDHVRAAARAGSPDVADRDAWRAATTDIAPATVSLRRDAQSLATPPAISAAGEYVSYREPRYDDEPIVVVVRQPEMAAEITAIAATNPTLLRYPLARIRTVDA